MCRPELGAGMHLGVGGCSLVTPPAGDFVGESPVQFEKLGKKTQFNGFVKI